MEPKIRNLSLLNLVLGTITFGWLILNIYYYNKDIVDVISGRSGIVAGIGYLLLLGFYISVFFLLFSLFRFTRKLAVLKIIAIILWTLSIVSLLVDKVMFDEIADAIRMGWEYGELKILNISAIVKAIFHVLVFIILYAVLAKRRHIETSSGIIKDERIFMIANVFGIITGLLGLYLVSREIQIGELRSKNIYYLPGYLIISIPYALAVFYWISMKVHEKITEWYDEKQFRDVLKSSLCTLILSIPGMTIIFLFENPVTFLWFPFYIFFILLVFSTCTLIQNKLR